eukprot:jgi/Psemu1/328906/estExt_fgenesh1_pg.C_29860002
MPRTYYLQSAPSIVLFLITAGLSWLLLVELQLPRAEAFVGTTTGDGRQQPSNNSNKTKKRKPAVILVHGFACSTVYWRQTRDYLAREGYTVHLVDLLGQGKSAKPGRNDGIVYSIDLWAQMVDDGGGGYLTSRVGGLCLFNCGVGLNTKNIVKVSSNPAWLKTILSVVFGVLDVLVFGNKPLLTYVLDQRVDKETLKSALTALYAYGEDKVDDELVDSFLDPVVKDETSSVVEVLSQIYTNDPGRTPMDLHDTYWSKSSSGKGDSGGIPVPIHLIWGDQDVVTPIQGDVGQFYSNLASSPDAPGVSMQVVENAGHVPFDERPECNQGLIEWLEKTNV